LNYVMSNSFGFGGINACVVLGRIRDWFSGCAEDGAFYSAHRTL